MAANEPTDDAGEVIPPPPATGAHLAYAGASKVSTAGNTAVVELFGNTEKPTLIVSDRTLEYQAYRASGSQSNDQLAQVFKRFATHEGPAPSEPEVRRSNYQPASSSPSTTVVPCRG